MIQIKGVTKYFGSNTAVQDISLNIAESENLILLGTSGCGKTTTLKMINRLIEPDSGTISINGKNIAEQNPELLRRNIGYVMQNTGLFPHYTIEQNIAVVPKLLKWDSRKTNSRIQELIEKLSLPQICLKQFPHQLSGGQQQRVGLARALVTDPPILLMDEPFGALDNVTRANIQAEFKALEELKRKTIVMVTHDVQEAFELGDRISLMHKGVIVQTGTPKELLYNPANDFVKEFLDGQRLALEFKVTTIQDVWPYLPNGNAASDQEKISDEYSIWSILELLKSTKNKTLRVESTHGEYKTVDFTAITSAFNNYQNNNSHE